MMVTLVFADILFTRIALTTTENQSMAIKREMKHVKSWRIAHFRLFDKALIEKIRLIKQAERTRSMHKGVQSFVWLHIVFFEVTS
ncbi:hypothetical protein BDA96_05G172600 [Sorghum bicolor]|uniref:Secreted protein n=1 Tax=Sorghum bicolor TaxID=4558 RepID=A0A921QYI5_SORBI|nr:hypothetical protein BDA96_05G172600 [Sorghum bicolor]